MLTVKSPWVCMILIAVSCTYALPPYMSPRLPNTSPPNHILEPRSLLINITAPNIDINSTSAECVGAVGLKITKFFILNYIGHAFTVKPGTGYKTTYMITFAIAAIFLPYWGLLLACRGMETCSVRTSHALKRAGSGGALCVVARTKKWRPRLDDKAWCWRTTVNGSKPGGEITTGAVNYQGLELEYLSQEYVNIHGVCHLPDGGEYMLARLPTDYEVEWEEVKACGEPFKITDKESNICSNYSVMRPMIALIQLLSAVPVIYEAHSQKSQESHGYAGYQLTVIPFALMSIVNTIQTMVTPSYGASYMVRSTVMDEAERRGAVFQGVVGKVIESDDQIQLEGLVEGCEQIIGEIGTFKDIRDEQNRVPESGVSYSCNTDHTSAQPPPTDLEGDVRVSSVADSDGIIAEPIATGQNPQNSCPISTAKPVATSQSSQRSDPIWVTFQDKTVLRYRGREIKAGKKRIISDDIKKSVRFIFRQQIWESLREEFPVFRWFLKPHGLTEMPNSQIPTIQNQAYTPEHKNEGQTRETSIARIFKRASEKSSKTSDESQGKDADRNLLKIVRVNPQSTCIARIFKRALEKEPKDDAMILVPAIGLPITRGMYRREVFMYYFTDILFILSFAAPYLITFGLTGYNGGKSTAFQRVIVLLWLVMMQVACIPQRMIWNFLQTRLVPLGSKFLDRGILFVIVGAILWSAPGIIGFYNVLRMLIDDNRGECDGAFAHLVDISGFGPGAT